MVEIADIRDGESLTAWLQGKPRKLAVFVAARSLARILPAFLVWSLDARNRDIDSKDNELAVWRAILTLHILSVSEQTAELVQAAGGLTTGIGYVNEATIQTCVAEAAKAALAPVYAEAAGNCAFAAARLIATRESFQRGALVKQRVFELAEKDFWADVDRDISLFNHLEKEKLPPLWGHGELLHDSTLQWEHLKEALLEATSEYDTGWQFWIDWYEAQLSGADQNWEMLKEIVLIPDEDWKQGATHVNAMIAGIVASYRVEDVIAENPYAHRIEYDQSRKRLVSHPIDTPDLAGIIAAIEQALEDFHKRCVRLDVNSNIGTAMQSALDLPATDLQRDLKRHQNDAAMLFEKLEAARREMDMIAKQEAFSKEGTFHRLTNDLERRAEDILSAAPAVLEMERNRVAVQVARYSEEQRLVALRLCAGMHNDSDGVLKAGAALAVQIILDPESSDIERRNAWYFLKAAGSRGAKAMKTAQAEPSSRQEAKSYLERAAKAGEHLSKIDKGVDAIQEMGGEGSDWVTEIYTQVASGNLFGWGGTP